MDKFLIKNKVTTKETDSVCLGDMTVITGTGIRSFIQILGTMLTSNPEDRAESMSLMWGSLYLGKMSLDKGSLDGFKVPTLWIPSCRLSCMTNIRYNGKEVSQFGIRIRYREELRDLLEDYRADLTRILEHMSNSGFDKIISHNRDSIKSCQFNGVKINGKSPINWNIDLLNLFPMQLSLMNPISGCKMGSENVHKYIILEEPEIGLHPDYIAAVMHQLTYLMSFGYKIIISTNSIDVVTLSLALKNYGESSDRNINVPLSTFAERLFNENEPSSESIGYLMKDMGNKDIKFYVVNSENTDLYVKDLEDNIYDPESRDNMGGLNRVFDSTYSFVNEYNS